MARRSFGITRPRVVLMAALVAISGCTQLVDFSSGAYGVRDGGVSGDDGGGGGGKDATTDSGDDDDDDDDGDDANGGRDGGKDAKVADSGPPYDACSAKGWALDCNFGDGGLLLMPYATDSGADSGEEVLEGPFVAVGPDGTAYLVNSLAFDGTYADEAAVYTVTDAGVTDTKLVMNIGYLRDVHVFGDMPLTLLSSYEGQAQTITLTPGDASVSVNTANLYSPYGFVSSSSSVIRALLVDEGAFPTPVGIADFGPPVATSEPTATVTNAPVGGVAASADAGTWVAVNPPGGTAEFLYESADHTTLKTSACDAKMGAVTGLATLGGDQAIAFAAAATSSSELTLYSLDPSDGGSCTPLPTLPSDTFYPNQYGFIAADNGGYTLAALSAFESSGDPAVLGVGHVSATGVLDTDAGLNGYTTVTLPVGAAKILPSVLAGDKVYVPVMLANYRPALFRFVRNP